MHDILYIHVSVHSRVAIMASNGNYSWIRFLKKLVYTQCTQHVYIYIHTYIHTCTHYDTCNSKLDQLDLLWFIE